jgi:hypothetical protein
MHVLLSTVLIADELVMICESYSSFYQFGGRDPMGHQNGTPDPVQSKAI